MLNEPRGLIRFLRQDPCQCLFLAMFVSYPIVENTHSYIILFLSWIRIFLPGTMVDCQKQKVSFPYILHQLRQHGRLCVLLSNISDGKKNVNFEFMFSQLLSWSRLLMVFVTPCAFILLFWKQLVDLAVFFLKKDLVIILPINQMKNYVILQWSYHGTCLNRKLPLNASECLTLKQSILSNKYVFRHLWQADISLMSILLLSRIWVLIGIFSRHSQWMCLIYRNWWSSYKCIAVPYILFPC